MQIAVGEVEATASRYKEIAQKNLFKSQRKQNWNYKTYCLYLSTLTELMNKSCFLPCFIKNEKLKGNWIIY